MRSTEVRLVARPHGEPQPGDFALETVDVPDPGEGEVLVRNTWMSVDPYMRGRMDEGDSYIAPFALGEPLDGGAVGEVVASRSPDLTEGDLVLHRQGWREVASGPAERFRRVEPVERPSWYLGILGTTGLSAYAGLVRVAGFESGETVFVSGAAGAVGSVVGQLVALRGGRAIGSAGTPDKVAWLREIGFAAAFDYHDGVAAGLRTAAPDGIDVYFDNVGGEHLEAAIDALRPHGRAALCGMISTYNATSPPAAPRNLALLVGKRLRLEGFLVGDHDDLVPEFTAEIGQALTEGRLQARETVVEGIGAAVEAFRGLLRGDNTGKMVVRLS